MNDHNGAGPDSPPRTDQPSRGGAPLKRTIAAIVAADVAGYSRLVAEDEEDALRRLAEHSSVFREVVAKYGGRVFNTAGDAILAEFPSAVEALRAAIEIQEQLRARNAEQPPARRLQFRMGITIGDVVERDRDLLGDGVNVAARLEGLAEPGGICVSRSVHEAVANKVPAIFRDIGRQKLKNIPQPVQVLRVMVGADAAQARAAAGARGRLLLLGSAAALLVVIVGGAWVVVRAMRADDQPVVLSSASEADRTTLTVGVARPRQQCFKDEARLGGTIVPREVVEVRPDTEGLRILRVQAEPLAQVAPGQTLAELISPDNPAAPAVPVRSPVQGVVGKSLAFVGAPASPRAPALFQIIPQGEMELAADVPASLLPRLNPGQTVTVTPLGLPPASGRIRTVSSSLDNATQQGRARILLRPDPALRWGTFARGVVALGERCGLGVPFSALSRNADGTAVLVANNNRVEARPVVTGLASENEVEVRGGLTENDLVVQRAGPFLREGDIIRPVVSTEASR